MDTVKLILNALLGLVIFAGILYLAYITTKYVGKRYQTGGKKGKNISLLENVPVGKESSIALVKAGEKYLLVGITSHGINTLSELDELQLDIDDEKPADISPMPFADALKKTFSEKFGKKDSATIHGEEQTDEEKHIN